MINKVRISWISNLIKGFYLNLKEIEKFAIEEIYKTNWHWFNYHFHPIQIALNHPFSTNIINCCYECEQRMEGYAFKFIKKLASYCNSEKDMRHYVHISEYSDSNARVQPDSKTVLIRTLKGKNR